VFEPRTYADKENGLIMGITGTVLVVGGGVGLMVTLISNTHCDDDRTRVGCHTDWTLGSSISVLALVAGCILTPIGWVQFGRSSPDARVTPLGAQPTAPTVSFTVLPVNKPAAATGGPGLTGGLFLGAMQF
jgi:hypothetical protein